MKLKEQLRQKIKLQGKSPKTYQTYWKWIESFLRWLHDNNSGQWMHPQEANREHVEQWLTWLVVKKHIGKNSQNVALQAVCYLYRELIGSPLTDVSAMRSQRPAMVRDVLSQQEIAAIFEHLRGESRLACCLMYGAGLRIGDVLSLRIKDISFERSQIIVHTSKGDKWRYVQFPKILHPETAYQIEQTRRVWENDRTQNPNGVSLPDAYRRKNPSAANQLAWYYLFPSETLSKGEEGVLCRHHLHGSTISRHLSQAVQRAGVTKRVSSHVLRHSYATHSHESGVPLRTLQQLLGHSDVSTTEIYTHADQNAATAAESPLKAVLRQELKPAASGKPQLKIYAG